MNPTAEAPEPLALRAGWPRHAVGLVLVAAGVLAALRVTGLFGPRAWAPLLPLGFVLMALLPWVMLTPAGRRQIGVQRSRSSTWYAVALCAGALAALLCGAVFSALFGAGPDHAYQTIAAYYQRQLDARGFSLLQLHLAFTLPALVFSPIGEELFFRGLLQRALQDRLSLRMATLGESALFATVHLCHHGVLYGAGGWELRPLSGVLWVMLMFGVALVLALLRRASGSIYPAMLAHAAFNASMNAYIFAWLWT